MNVNIGGGKGWQHKGWINLDRSTGYILHPETVFPVPDKSAEIVYSSHCFEHLNDATVDQMLRETRRALNGTFVLKIPDFDAVLEAWRYGDEAYLSAERWGMTKVIQTWKNRGVENNIDSRASMIFCGWWNDSYGNEFDDRHPEAEGAYHGPAHGLQENRELMISRYSPHEIADTLSSHVKTHEHDAHFNHQNAWSRDELSELLTGHGFDVSMDVVPHLDIPGLRVQQGISIYVIAT